jgi:16S rRNA (guanine527-N7)-methyltransferase
VIDALKAALSAANLSLGDDVVLNLARYMEYVLAANETQNLTALRSPDLFAREGVVDSVRAWMASGVRGGTPLVDVGSGSGLPALVWLCAGFVPQATLVEAERRKTEFLRSAAADLGLQASVVWGRAEELAHGSMRDAAPLVSARALAAAALAVEVTGALVQPGGHLLLLKGRHAADEEEAARPVAVRMGFAPAVMRSYALPGGVERTVLVYRKRRTTPAGRPASFARLRQEFPPMPKGKER